MRIILLIAGLWLALPTLAAEPPRVVVSLLPLHSLAAAVMQGVASPQLLVEGGRSPHDFSLRPSAARALHQADLIVWAGPEVEAFLQQPLAASRARVLTLLDAPGLRLLAGSEAHSEHHQHSHSAGQRDGHIWLDPRNAQVIVTQLVAALTALDPPHAPRYQRNGEQLSQRLAHLDQALEQRLAPLRARPFLVYHDAYRYFETRYHLHAVGAVSLAPERTPGARRVQQLRALIQSSGARCVFSEPQFQSRLLPILTEGSAAQAAPLDPLGAGLTPGPEAYFELMQQLVDQFAACLDPPTGATPDA